MQTGKTQLIDYNNFGVTYGHSAQYDYFIKTITIFDYETNTEATATIYRPEEQNTLDIIYKEIRTNAKNKTFYKIASFLEKLCFLYGVNYNIGVV